MMVKFYYFGDTPCKSRDLISLEKEEMNTMPNLFKRKGNHLLILESGGFYQIEFGLFDRVNQ